MRRKILIVLDVVLAAVLLILLVSRCHAGKEGKAESTPEAAAETEPPSASPTPTATPTATPTPTPTPTPVPTPYGYNEMDINFSHVSTANNSADVKKLNAYFSSLTVSQQNAYTGLFKGKNLIMICAESFCPYVIDKNLTPALYKLYSEGFQFTNYYQPGWYQSTSGGEFAFLTGLIPTLVNGERSFSYTGEHSTELHFSLANQLDDLGYTSLAYHDYLYNDYGRDLTHSNLGYDYKGVGNGLELPDSTWPNSDLEMMQATVPDYSGSEPFNVYYMTVSGHGYYGVTNNAMSKKNWDAVKDLPYSDTVKAYLASQMELEYSLEYLLNQLDATGHADDTVIVLTGDHYPDLLDGDHSYDMPLYNELAGYDFNSDQPNEMYRNTLLLWCGSMESPVKVDTPCSSIDVVPTLLNLFGVRYDSRLLSGRDIFAENYDPYTPSNTTPLVILTGAANSSWITDAGYFCRSSGQFTPNPGYFEAGEDVNAYVSAVCDMVNAKYYAAQEVIASDYYSILF
jgi:lipoteichoic acid synthase